MNGTGGINGHPLQLKTCPVNLDLNKAASCARQAAADKSVIAANVFMGQPEAVLDIFGKAGIPVISDYPIPLAQFSCQVCFPTSAGAFTSVAGEGLLAATQLKAQRVSFVAIDVPSSRGLASAVSQVLHATVIPALAAAMIGGFSSFWLTLAGGLLIGVAEAEITRFASHRGWSGSFPFLIVVAVLVLRGHALPLRGHLGERLPAIGSGVLRPVPIAAALAVSVVSILTLGPGWVNAVITSAGYAIVALSLVVLIGYAPGSGTG